MDEACSTYGVEERYIQDFGGKTWEDHLEGPGVYKIISIWVFGELDVEA